MADRPTIPKAGIQRKVLVLILPLVIVSMLTISLISFHFLSELSEKQSERFLLDRHNEILTISEDQSVANYFHNVAYGLSEEAALIKGELERYFKRFSDRYNSIDHVYIGIRFINNKGREIAKYWGDKVGGEYQNVYDTAFFQSTIELASGTVYTSLIAPRMTKSTPIYWDEDGNGVLSDNELRGVIAVDFLYPLKQFQRERLFVAIVTIGVTILAILITAITVNVLLRRVTRPLHQLVDATKAISSGDLSTEIAVQSDDEVGLLSASFNQMAQDLRVSIDDKDRYAGELAKLNLALEDKVKARTMELEKTNKDLQIANVKIKEADRLKSEFLANMSHELRTPMNAIIGFTRLVRRKTADLLPLRQQENLNKVEISAKQLLTLINDILDLSKIEAGKMIVNTMPVNLAALLDTCLTTVEPLVRKDKVRLFMDVPDDFPEVLSDPDKLKQILINLLSNALKFTEEGEVKLSAAREAASLSIAVADTGTGIPSDALAYIFDEFRQVDGSTTRKHGGTGLGLSITKKLTHLLGGTIAVSSTEGKGATFTVTFPINEGNKELRTETAIPDEEIRAHAGIMGKKVLLAIDDDPNVLILLKENLEDEGVYVVGALSADEGIRKVKEIHPFAVTLDIMLPQKDGWAVLSQLKADPATREIPIIVLSIIDNKELGFSLGAFDYLVKPFDNEAIMDVLRRIPADSNKRVLVVDDEPAAVDLLNQILRDEGYQVKTACNGKEALSVLDAAPQDIILLDLLMPDMDGFEVIQQVKKNKKLRDIPIIVVTAKDLTDADLEFLHRSVDKIIRKSGLGGEDLIEEIRSIFHEHDAAKKENGTHEENPGCRG